MAEQSKATGSPPEGLDEFLAADDPQAAASAQGWQAAGQAIAPLAEKAGENLEQHQALINDAIQGNEAAKQQLIAHNLGAVMGSHHTPQFGAIVEGEGILPASETGVAYKLHEAQALQNEGGANAATQQATTERVGREMARQQATPQGSFRPKRMAEGGDVSAPPPPGLDEFIASSPGASPMEPAREPAAATPPGLDEFIAPEMQEEKYGTPGQQAIAGLEGAAEGASFGLSTGAERALGVNPEDIRARREENPGTHMVGQMAGLATSALIPGVGEANLLRAAGEAGAGAVGLGVAESAGALAKIGSAAVQGAIENMIFQGADETSKMLMKDPNQSVQTAVLDTGLAGLIGGAVGGSATGVGNLWQETMADKVGGLLKAIRDKAGGIKGQLPDAMNDAIQKSGMDLAPEIRAGLSSDPELQEMFKTLEQSDTTKSGKQLQETYKNFRNEASENIAKSLGRDPSMVPELSHAETGKSIGKTLADEFKTQMDPIVDQYENIRTHYSDLPLDDTETVAGLIGPKTTDSIADKLGELTAQEGWAVSPSSEIMGHVNRVLKEVPNLKTIKDLSSYISAVGDSMQSNPLNGSLMRAGGKIKGIMKEAEADVLGHAIGSEEGPEAIAAFANARKAYAQQSALKEALDSRLHVKGSTSGFAKNLSSMAQTDGEAVLRRLSGVGDADLLQFLSKNYPKTAELLKNYHLDNVVRQGLDKAKPGESINANAMIKSIEKMSPELRAFSMSGEQLAKVKAVNAMLDQFNSYPHNFSNTARTVDKLMQHLPASALAIAAMITGHNPALALVLAPLTKYLGKDLPDATKLGLLKFLGSNKPIEAGAFKSMVDYMEATAKGESTLSKASKNLFKTGKTVVPTSLMPTERDRAKIDKHVTSLQGDPTPLFKVGEKVGHYMPEHAQAMGQTATTVTNYLNTLRPVETPALPLDKKPPVSPFAKAAYNQALNIAQQPLVVLDKVQQGTITPQDVQALSHMYPDLYKNMVGKINQEMIEAVNKGQVIPYKTKLGLSILTAQPLDSSMTSPSIMSAQPLPKPAPGPAPMGGMGKKPKRGTASLNKLPKSYQTPGQAAEADRVRGD